MTLRSRLSATYAAVLLIALLLFAAAAVAAIDRTLRSTLDARLNTSARAAASLNDVHDGKIVDDEDDRRQFLTLIGSGDQAIVRDLAGNVHLSSVIKPPAAILRLPPREARYYTIGVGQNAARAYVLPVQDDGTVAGSVVVWSSSDLIAQTDRGAAIAFVVAAAIIAIFALIAGAAVTQRALEDAFARQRRFTADASHELRAPLAVIRAEADLALKKQRDAPAYRGAIEAIAAEADRMEALIEDLLSAARAESGRFNRQPVAIAPILQRIAQRLGPAAAAKGAAIDVLAQDQVEIVADADALERAVLAIAHNAVKYAPERGRVELQTLRAGNAAEIRVSDDGPGFSKDALNHALERFWRGDAHRAQGGSGLGLAIARASVRALGGTMRLENNPGGGAAVRLRFVMRPRSRSRHH